VPLQRLVSSNDQGLATGLRRYARLFIKRSGVASRIEQHS
jgi:hypothetical protein